ncbi:hypothetical protein SCHPADRAFT_1000850 [Schizopora paradoxa]|uniref:Uncharacterized protein n=1 Tax=Schizopora paradoxa TaxID=27342 RepID=A0A0H2RAY3_9AGAM|nr:hypothetical protein SCHPADRAFT_1000850 [Schizopora paradoxa]
MSSPTTPALVPSPALYAASAAYAYPYGGTPPPPRSTSAVSASSSAAGSSSSKPGDHSKAKKQNVFSDDGGFLDRIKRSKMEEAKKDKDSDKVAARREFENRFKNRRKRPIESTTDDTELPAKKTKAETEDKDGERKKADNGDSTSSKVSYTNEVQGYSNKGNPKDSGAGVRSLVK